MFTQEQVEARRSGIGASESAAVLGLSKWASPMDVYLDKLGQEREPTDNEYTYWGTQLEDDVRQRFAEEHPEYVVKAGLDEFPPHGIRTSLVHPFLFCSPDGICYEEVPPNLLNPVAGFEAKTASQHKAKEWPESGGDPKLVPVDYWCQCQHSMLCTGLPVWWLAVLIGGNDYREFLIEADPEFQEMALVHLTAFWSLVEKRTPPAIDGSEASRKVLDSLYPADAVIMEAPVALPEESDAVARRVIEGRRGVDDAKIALRLAENQLREMMGEYGVGYTPAGYEVTWKAVHRKSYNVKAQDYRILRVTEGEE